VFCCACCCALRSKCTSDLEVMACVSQGAIDAGTKMVVLDALATFVGEQETPGREYDNFLNQEALEKHCSTNSGCDVFLKRKALDGGANDKCKKRKV